MDFLFYFLFKLIIQSTTLSFYVFVDKATEYLFGNKYSYVFKILWVIVVFIGSQSALNFVWDLADTVNGLMMIPNLVALIYLSNEVVRLKDDYLTKYLINE